MSPVMEKLRGAVLKIRAKPDTHIIKLSNTDSEELAKDIYNTVPMIWGQGKLFCEMMLFCDFIEKIKAKELNDFVFCCIHLKWFCGDKTKIILKESENV